MHVDANCKWTKRWRMTGYVYLLPRITWYKFAHVTLLLQNDVINRLLKAQTGKTRRNVAQNEGTPLSGLDGDDAMNGGGASDGARNAQVVPGMLRFVSSIKSGKFEMLVSAPPGKETAIEFESPPRAGHVAAEKKTEARCAVRGCSEKRKYRSVLDFETGGCSMPHLKLVEQSLRRA